MPFTKCLQFLQYVAGDFSAWMVSRRDAAAAAQYSPRSAAIITCWRLLRDTSRFLGKKYTISSYIDGI